MKVSRITRGVTRKLQIGRKRLAKKRLAEDGWQESGWQRAIGGARCPWFTHRVHCAKQIPRTRIASTAELMAV
jgi:hypothetical protein